MKYIDFESWTITWLHEGNVIVEDQLTHNFKRRSRTAPPNRIQGGSVPRFSLVKKTTQALCIVTAYVIGPPLQHRVLKMYAF